MYDGLTVLTACARPGSSLAARVALAGLSLYCGASRSYVAAPSRVIACALAEELIWRDPAHHQGWNVLGFAALHRRGGPQQVLYHAGTGVAFALAGRWGGLPAAVAVHAAHNLAVERRRAETSRRAGRSVAAPAVVETSQW